MRIVKKAPMKLKESIPSNSVKIIELYNKINSEILDTRPSFQRKLVWKKQHKYHFIETILLNFPFPEIYIASAEIDVVGLTSKEIVVDGQQRLTAIVDYIKGINDFENQTKITPFDKLETDDKKSFLNYLVTVKDLKDIDSTIIKNIFQRINNTEYSLNAVEKTNAQYGDGEFAIFCKQVIDADYNPTSDDTDIILIQDVKKRLNEFFCENDIFSSSDKSRMFDFQYIMLIASTFLEGGYYGRSTKVEDYLKEFNSSFPSHQVVLDLLLKSINTISELKLNNKSYWFNKANLFTLIIELSKVDTTKLSLEKFETLLLDLETKNDIYFSAEDDSENTLISEDEKKYFEVARHGSHEKAARIHRGKVVSEIIIASMTKSEPENSLSEEQKRLQILTKQSIAFITIEPTKTGLEKSIMDATSSVREFLKAVGIHDYESQGSGSDYKVKKVATYIYEDGQTKDCEISLYRSNNRGDARIWFSGLNGYASPNDIIAIIFKNHKTYLFNITKFDILKLANNPNPIF